MKIAYEAPIGNTIMAIAEGDYIFAIAPMLKIPEYAEVVKRTRELTRPRPLHIDNGVYEDQLMEVDEYIELCYSWDPDVVVLPDVLLNRAETERLATEFLEKTGPKRPFEVMLVLQGRNLDERVACYFHIANKYDIQIIGLGLGAFDKDWRSRIQFLSLLDSAYTKRIHTLGIMNIADLCFWKGVAETTDTSLPFHLAQEEKDLLRKKETKHLDWNDTLAGKRLALAESNISMLEGILENV